MTKTLKTETKQTHTPTPWKVNGRWIETDREEGIAKVGEWVSPLSLANATFIVRAVNSHEELLEALRREHEKVVDELTGSQHGSLCLVCALIAKAEGQS